MDPQRIADELSIRSLVHRYSDAIVRRDAEAWASTWASDGEWVVLGDTVRGRELVVEHWKGLMGRLPFVHQQSTGGLIELADLAQAADDDTATGRWYVTEHGFLENGTGLLTLGVYHDNYVRENDAWRFARRRFDPLYMGPPDLSGVPRQFPTDV